MTAHTLLCLAGAAVVLSTDLRAEVVSIDAAAV